MNQRRRQLVRIGLLAAAIGSGVALGQAALVSGFDLLLPDARGISAFNRPGTLTILSADGQVVQKIGPATREKLTVEATPALVEQAFIAAEDRRFYRHDGIDLVGIGRAMVRNITRHSVEEGASTITQQLARTVYLSQDRTILRKFAEIALAGKLERQLSKKQILTEYLNVVYLGSSAYGVADAAWIYFSKTPNQLTLPEAALIAGLPPAPSVYSPLVTPHLALERRAIVLRRMQEAGFISADQQAEANATPLQLKPAEPKYFQSRAPYFTSWVQQQLSTVLTKEQLEVGGLTVKSSLNLAWQEQAQKAIDTYAPGEMEGALVAMEPGTGLVRAMVGGKDFAKSQFNRAADALRSPGSTFKLFVYLTALKEGMRPERIVVDTPRCFAGYCPRNFGDRYMGSIPMVVAIQNSLNIVAVGLLQQLGFDKVIETAKSLGIGTVRELGHYYPLAIGAYEQTLLEMTTAYAAINNSGIFVKATPFEEVLGPNGELLWSRRVDGERGRRAVDGDIANTMLWMLQQVVKGGTGAGAALPNRPVAGKTGTSEGGRDLWFIGSIPQLTTGVWLGYDSNQTTGNTSVVATYAWRAFMEPITKNLPVRQFPQRPVLQTSYAGDRKNVRKPPGAGAGNGYWAPTLPAPDPTATSPDRLAPIPEGTPTNGPPPGVSSPAAPAAATPNMPPPPVAAPPTP
ncbi:transglycosylase domain-containing protein [Cyanobium sp. WAJ14-Wanaka]|uniref:transglycosylase domain-containing protein n=1 Tax=Cyanobium sp. WAJ14-Wanaka TaxID=2823725 RepID=UPI0020CD9A1B|nr:PBP1A family penicillin-binding protein [Cyanobium sp. WAJ14-Wanaka]MCP9774063.1 PBP1A family penicillin-binding protein [Cyanobium sp. WAJ14-Wanaka]